MGALWGPGRNGIASTPIPLPGTQAHAPKSLGKVPGRSAGGIFRAWPPGVVLAGEAAVFPSQAPNTYGVTRGPALDHCTCAGLAPHWSPSSLTFSSYFLPNPVLAPVAPPLHPALVLGERLIVWPLRALVERCPRDSMTKDIWSGVAGRGAFQEGEPGHLHLLPGPWAPRSLGRALAPHNVP